MNYFPERASNLCPHRNRAPKIPIGEADCRAKMDRVCFGSTSEVPYACLSCIGCLQCPCERFSVQQPENSNTDGKLALLTGVHPHPTFGTLACSRNADCGPGSNVFGRPAGTNSRSDSYLVDPASSHMLVSKIKPCMSKYKPH